MRHRRIIPSLPPVRVWAAEITVDEPLARRLIGSQFPEVDVWSLLPPAGRADFIDEYGPLRDDQLLRARVLAVNLCAILALYGHHEGMTAVEREAFAGLDRAVPDELADAELVE